MTTKNRNFNLHFTHPFERADKKTPRNESHLEPNLINPQLGAELH